jgi:class 3 adenylate cyclase
MEYLEIKFHVYSMAKACAESLNIFSLNFFIMKLYLKLLIPAILTFLSYSSFAIHSPDSLIQKIASAEGKKKILLLHELNNSCSNDDIPNPSILIKLYKEGLIIADSLHDLPGKARIFSYLGFLQEYLGNDAEAQENLLEALNIYTELNDIERLNILNHLGIINRKQMELGKAYEYFDKAIKIATVDLLKINNDLQVAKRKESKIWYFIYGGSILLLFVLLILGYREYENKNMIKWYQDKQMKSIVRSNKKILKQKYALEVEKKKSEKLMLNLLPAAIAVEMKKKGFVAPKFYDSVTVMLIAFHNFNQIATTYPPEILINELNRCFVAFDKIVVENGVEKIKTTGDYYICAAGINNESSLHPLEAVKTALQMQKYMQDLKTEKGINNSTLEVTIGIHTGSIIAGVVGKIKFSFDIWGDTVNIASLLGKNGKEGKINISETTANLLKDRVLIEYNGRLNQEIDVYSVKGLQENILIN